MFLLCIFLLVPVHAIYLHYIVRPCHATIRIDTDTNVVTTFGKVSEEKNKYQGGTLAPDGFIYAIPSNANDILCIDTNPKSSQLVTDEIAFKEEDAAFGIGDIYKSTQTRRKDKWQGEQFALTMNHAQPFGGGGEVEEC